MAPGTSDQSRVGSGAWPSALFVGLVSAGAAGVAGVLNVNVSDQGPSSAWTRHQYCLPATSACVGGALPQAPAASVAR